MALTISIKSYSVIKLSIRMCISTILKQILAGVRPRLIQITYNGVVLCFLGYKSAPSLFYYYYIPCPNCEVTLFFSPMIPSWCRWAYKSVLSPGFAVFCFIYLPFSPGLAQCPGKYYGLMRDKMSYKASLGVC